MENIFMIIYFLGRIESWIIFMERRLKNKYLNLATAKRAKLGG
jgi:hypothetical protein